MGKKSTFSDIKGKGKKKLVIKRNFRNEKKKYIKI